MKNLSCHFGKFAVCAALFAISCSGAFAQIAEAVACVGRVVPGARVAKLSAAVKGGAAVVEKFMCRKGQLVKSGDVIAVLDGEDEARAAVKSAEASLECVRAAGAIRLLQQKNLIADLEGSFAQNKRVLDEKDPPRREREEMEYEQDALKRRIAQSKAMLPLVETSERAALKQAEAAVKQAEASAESYLVKSPIDGEIVELNINAGEAVGYEGICEIADTNAMFVEAEVYVSDVAKVKVGDKAEIFSDALGADKKFDGVVSEISGYVKSNRIYSSDPGEFSNLRVVIAKIKLSEPAAFRNFIGSQVNVRILSK